MKIDLLCALAALIATQTFAAPFRNLGFDEADVGHLNPNGTGTPAALLPGWDKSFGDAQIFYNSGPAGLGYAALVPAQNQAASPPLPVQGLYSFLIAPTVESPTATFGQQGDVPVDAKLLTFVNYGAPFELRLNGSVIPVTYFESQFPSDATHHVRQGLADVSAFAGQNVDLTFTTLIGPTPFHGLDSIAFSSVPEPSSLGLFGLGLAGLSWSLGHRILLCRSARFLFLPACADVGSTPGEQG